MAVVKAATKKLKGLLDDSMEARLKRAREMGFDTDTVYYHGNGANVDEFLLPTEGKTAGSGVFFSDSPVVSNSYAKGITEGGTVYPAHLNQKNFVRVKHEQTSPNWNDIDTNDLYIEYPDGSGDMALDVLDLEPNDFTTTDELAMLLRDKGYEGAIFEDITDVGPNSNTYQIADSYLQDMGYKRKDSGILLIGDPSVKQEDLKK